MPAKLQSVDVLVERGAAPSRRMAYYVAGRLPAGVVVRLGERLYINTDRLDAYIEAGGDGAVDLSPRPRA